ncbi:glycosyltransferase [Candidatus Sumerlaeota bacterium]|nr:glycosyltransferase [Candidatus Sumerlaeota bacterium]
MSRILVLSAHGTQLDRRIVGETNALVESGRDATLVSVPTRIEAEGLDPRVRAVVESGGEFESSSSARRVARRLPSGLYGLAQSLWYLFGSGPSPHNTAYFLRNVPAGETFDAIHCHDLKTLPAGIEVRKRQCPRARLIYDAHEFFPFQTINPFFQRYWTRIERACLSEVNLAIAVNQSIAEAMAGLYGTAIPEILYNSCAEPCPAPAGNGDFAKHFGSPSSAGRKIVFQGNLSADRNLRNLTLAFRHLEGRASLFFLGEGTEKERLRSLCRRKRISNVHFGAWTSHRRMMAFVAAADAGVIPYRESGMLNSLYCTPNKLFEFIEAGVAVCASDLPELRRIVREGEIGDVYPMGSEREIAAALDAFLARLDRGEFRPESFDRARERYSWKTQAANLIRWYERLGV